MNSLLTRLQNPPSTYRPCQIVHCFYPKTEAEIARYLDLAEENHMGGFVVNMDYYPPREEGEDDEAYRRRHADCYMGDGSEAAEQTWRELGMFIDACFARDFKVWIYDELAYPSGAAGGMVLKDHPEYQVKGLACVSAEVMGGKGTVAGEKGTLLHAAAYPILENGRLCTEKALPILERDGELHYDLPSGHYRIVGVYCKPIAFLTENRVPVVDLMRADVVDRFLAVTHEAYLAHLGAERISKITAFFTDEPGLPTHGCSSYFYEKNAIAAYTDEIAERLDMLAERAVDLFFETDRDFAAFRRAYWGMVGDLFAKNYFGRIGAWCEAHGTCMTGHLYGEETLSMQIGLNGDLFGLMRYMQMPGVDRLYCSNPRDVIAEKTASSAAHLYGRKHVMSENSFHLEHNFWKKPEDATAENRLNSAFYQIQLGMTHVASYFGYPDADRASFEDQVARAVEFCTFGTHVAHNLILIPMNGAYERFMPPDHKYWDVGPCTVAPYQPKPIQVLEKAYGDTLLALQDARQDYDLIDESGLLSCEVKNGCLETATERFAHLVLFDSGEISNPIAEKLEAFLKSGGRASAIATDRPSKLCRELAGKYPDRLRMVDADSIVSVTNETVEPILKLDAPNTVRVRKTESEEWELWFLHNRGEACEVALKEPRITGIASPRDGVMKPLAGETPITLSLERGEARMLIRRKA